MNKMVGEMVGESERFRTQESVKETIRRQIDEAIKGQDGRHIWGVVLHTSPLGLMTDIDVKAIARDMDVDYKAIDCESYRPGDFKGSDGIVFIHALNPDDPEGFPLFLEEIAQLEEGRIVLFMEGEDYRITELGVHWSVERCEYSTGLSVEEVKEVLRDQGVLAYYDVIRDLSVLPYFDTSILNRVLRDNDVQRDCLQVSGYLSGRDIIYFDHDMGGYRVHPAIARTFFEDIMANEGEDRKAKYMELLAYACVVYRGGEIVVHDVFSEDEYVTDIHALRKYLMNLA